MVWIHFRSLEWGIKIDSNYREMIKSRAWDLLVDLFGDQKDGLQISLRQYYESMRLRGDHPDIYRSEAYNERHKISFIEYERYKEAKGQELVRLRHDASVYRLMQRYHFDYMLKQKSRMSTEFDVEGWYIDVAKRLQKAMRRRVAERGIAIECNPTSNYLIGVFRDYTKHPMFVFNKDHLEGTGIDEPQLTVTVNTDDIGVFDTSLKNEYAVVLMALKKKRHAAGNYDDEAIYEYLEMLRENGHIVSFVQDERRMSEL